MVTAVTPSLSPDIDNMYHDISLRTNIGVTLHNVITQIPRESLTASGRPRRGQSQDPGHRAMCPPQGRAGH